MRQASSRQRPGTRHKIVEAALDIIETDGVHALTQPRIARQAGIRQSHLTYYFPRKADLYVALLEASHRRVEAISDDNQASLAERLGTLIFSKTRMRFLVSILLEVGDEPKLQAIVRRHLSEYIAEIGAQIGMPQDDPRLVAFIDEVRGLGLRNLLSDAPEDPVATIQAAAARHRLDLG